VWELEGFVGEVALYGASRSILRSELSARNKGLIMKWNFLFINVIMNDIVTMCSGFSTLTKESDMLSSIEDTHFSVDIGMIDTDELDKDRYIIFLF
jgi:hypothetical protein